MNIELTLAEVRAVRNTRPRDPEGTRTILPNTSPAAIFWWASPRRQEGRPLAPRLRPGRPDPHDDGQRRNPRHLAGHPGRGLPALRRARDPGIPGLPGGLAAAADARIKQHLQPQG